MISYEAEGVKFPNIKKRETTNWIRQVAESYGKKVGEIGYMLVTTTIQTSLPLIIPKGKRLMATCLSLWTPYSPMLTNLAVLMMKSCIA